MPPPLTSRARFLRRFTRLLAGAALIASTLAGPAWSDPCPNPKSAAFSFVFADPGEEAVRHTVPVSTPVATNATANVAFQIVTDTTFTTTAGRVLFRAPGTGTKLVRGTLDVATGTVQGGAGAFEMLTVGFGPVNSDGTTVCADRVTVTDDDPDIVTAGTPFSANTIQVSQFAPDDGDTAFVASLNLFDGAAKTFNVRFSARFRPGAVYELFIAGVYRSGLASAPGVSADLTAGFAGNSPPPVPVVVVPDRVKVQPAIRSGNCTLTSLEHLLLAIRIEQAIRLRIDRRATEIQAAIDAVGNAGVNPGPALRALDALVAAVRDDVRAENRDAVRGGLEIARRHLECAKDRLPDSGLSEGQQALAALEIDQAITDDADAITASQTENTMINSEAVRLVGTLQSTSQLIGLALFNKQQAGEILDPQFQMPDFSSVDPDAAFEEFQTQVAAASSRLADVVEAQQGHVRESGVRAAIDAIRAVQQAECIAQFIDEVALEYEQVHTLVRERLARIKEEADAAAQMPDPPADAPTPAQGREAVRDTQAIDRAYVKVSDAVARAEENLAATYGGLIGSEQERLNRKVRALQLLLRRAELINDRAWRRLIRKELKKLVGFYGQGI